MSNDDFNARKVMWDTLLRVQTLPKKYYEDPAWDNLSETYAQLQIDPVAYQRGQIRRLDDPLPCDRSMQDEQENRRKQRMMFGLEPIPGREHIKRGLPDWF